MREKSEEIDRALGIESDTFTPTDNGGFVQQGDGYLIMGMGDDLETTPRPMPPEAELRKAAETPHNYPDLALAPLREQFESDAAFDKAMIHWLVNVAPAVVRRNKRFERLQLKPGATANDIVAAIRAQAKGGGETKVSPHPYPDLPQAPTREEFPDEEAFEEAMAGWKHRVAPIVAMRLKYGKPRSDVEGPAQ